MKKHAFSPNVLSRQGLCSYMEFDNQGAPKSCLNFESDDIHIKTEKVNEDNPSATLSSRSKATGELDAEHSPLPWSINTSPSYSRFVIWGAHPATALLIEAAKGVCNVFTWKGKSKNYNEALEEAVAELNAALALATGKGEENERFK